MNKEKFIQFLETEIKDNADYHYEYQDEASDVAIEVLDDILIKVERGDFDGSNEYAYSNLITWLNTFTEEELSDMSATWFVDILKYQIRQRFFEVDTPEEFEKHLKELDL